MEGHHTLRLADRTGEDVSLRYIPKESGCVSKYAIAKYLYDAPSRSHSAISRKILYVLCMIYTVPIGSRCLSLAYLIVLRVSPYQAQVE